MPRRGEYVDVCPLCQEIADEYGWRKEGSPTTPTVPVQRRRRQGLLQSIFAPLQSAPEETVASEPILRRLSEPELQTVEAADHNASDYRRTIGGVSKSLGEPRASILPLAGVNQGLHDHDRLGHHLVPVPRLAGVGAAGEARGARPELGDLDGAFQAWNARIQPDAGSSRRSPSCRGFGEASGCAPRRAARHPGRRPPVPPVSHSMRALLVLALGTSIAASATSAIPPTSPALCRRTRP